MSNLRWFERFVQNDEGAVTVDWVVLTAVICFVSITVVASVQRAALDQSNGIGAYVSSQASLMNGN